MYDILCSINNVTVFVIIPALGIASIFYFANLRSKASLILMLGFLLVAIGPFMAFVFPECFFKGDEGEFSSETNYVESYWDDELEREVEFSPKRGTKLNYVHNFMMDAGFLLLLIGLSATTFAKMRKKNSEAAD